jgi:hypothetical protein
MDLEAPQVSDPAAEMEVGVSQMGRDRQFHYCIISNLQIKNTLL